MADLIAAACIQTDMGFTRYQPGDILPADHPDAPAWLESGAAFWREGESLPEWVKAEQAAARPGLSGISAGSETDGDDLAGRVPMTEQRRREPCLPSRTF